MAGNNGSNGPSLCQRLFKTRVTTKNEKMRLYDAWGFFYFFIKLLKKFLHCISVF